MRPRRLFALLTFAALLLTVGCQGTGPSSSSTPLTVLTIGTADSGGTMYPVGSAIASALSTDQLRINVGASTGSVMNIRNLADGQVDLALVSGDAAYSASHDPDGNGAELRAIAAVFTSVSNWVAPVSTGARYVHDLKGMRVGVGPENSTTELAALAAIQALGLDKSDTTLENCGLGAGTEQVLEGKLDAIHGFSGIPIQGLTQLTDQVSCRVLVYTQEELDTILALHPIYTPAVIPAGTYSGQRADIQTFGVKALLCVNASMDKELVRSLTQALWESREALAQEHPAMADMSRDEFLYEDLPIPLHKGAEDFYNSLSS